MEAFDSLYQAQGHNLCAEVVGGLCTLGAQQNGWHQAFLGNCIPDKLGRDAVV